MIPYQLVMLKKGPSAATPGLRTHKAYSRNTSLTMFKLGAEGTSMAAGPFTDGGDIQGILIVKADTPDKAREIESAYPAKAGISRWKVAPFTVARRLSSANGPGWGVRNGGLRVPEQRAESGEDAETARVSPNTWPTWRARRKKEELIRGRAVHRGGHHVAALCRLPCGRRSSEAKRCAEADPMVKAGRLAVELHPVERAAGGVADVAAITCSLSALRSPRFVVRGSLSVVRAIACVPPAGSAKAATFPFSLFPFPFPFYSHAHDSNVLGVAAGACAVLLLCELSRLAAGPPLRQPRRL